MFSIQKRVGCSLIGSGPILWRGFYSHYFRTQVSPQGTLLGALSENRTVSQIVLLVDIAVQWISRPPLNYGVHLCQMGNKALETTQFPRHITLRRGGPTGAVYVAYSNYIGFMNLYAADRFGSGHLYIWRSYQRCLSPVQRWVGMADVP